MAQEKSRGNEKKSEPSKGRSDNRSGGRSTDYKGPQTQPGGRDNRPATQPPSNGGGRATDYRGQNTTGWGTNPARDDRSRRDDPRNRPIDNGGRTNRPTDTRDRGSNDGRVLNPGRTQPGQNTDPTRDGSGWGNRDDRKVPTDRRANGNEGRILTPREGRTESPTFRTGYVPYEHRRDTRLYYNHYTTRRDNSCFSPFYYYSFVPSYIDRVRVCNTPIFSISFRWDNCRYDWSYRDRYDRWDSADLDYAVRDLRRAFTDRSIRSLQKVLPRRGDITITTKYDRPYNLRADDFEDMMTDIVLQSETRRYDILRVDRNNRYARVLAQHVFRDSCGDTRTAYHWYTLEDDGFGYEIREFRSDDRRWDDCD